MCKCSFVSFCRDPDIDTHLCREVDSGKIKDDRSKVKSRSRINEVVNGELHEPNDQEEKGEKDNRGPDMGGFCGETPTISSRVLRSSKTKGRTITDLFRFRKEQTRGKSFPSVSMLVTFTTYTRDLCTRLRTIFFEHIEG